MSTSPTNSPEDANVRRVRSMGDIPQQPNPTASLPRRTTHSGPLPDPFNPRPITQVEENTFFEQARNLNVSRLDRLLAHLGLGRMAMQPRKAYAALLWSFVWSFAQIAVIVTLVALSGAVFKDATRQTLRSELVACDRPLGVWACLWIARVMISTALSYWEYLRELEAMEHFISGALCWLGEETERRPFLAPMNPDGINRFGNKVFWNILLICLGRHPIQNPHVIKPDIEKIPKALVDKIPLVMYIPPPPEGSEFKSTSPKIITHPHTYPPAGIAKPVTKPKPRFRFLKPKTKSKDIPIISDNLPADVEKSPGSGQPLTWSDYWEDSEYPFVVLEGNRAACAICLLDFEEPKRKPGLEHPLGSEKETGSDPTVTKPTPVESTVTEDDGDSKNDKPAQDEKKSKKSSTDQPVEEVRTSTTGITLEARSAGPSALQLEDAGEEAQPLRLLTCGHVFHVENMPRPMVN
ncbi:hypothetical protein NP233_g4454 [Leucocoprinus birnbaumii]|uniref:Uncharacterized protein n=1 Tax=Leucocoprinus birnbaumii TaxID=56174 RepID=A0AAD5VYD2_9AGAR|nr:hypothetical protein NP233_g4454 [Leucocoprinus birnbaumii]